MSNEEDAVRGEMGPYADAVTQVTPSKLYLDPPANLSAEEANDFNARALAAFWAMQL